MPIERTGRAGEREQSVKGTASALSATSSIGSHGSIMYQPIISQRVQQRLSASQRGAILATRTRGYRKGGTVVRKARVIISAGQN